MSKGNIWSKSFELDVNHTPEQIWQAFVDTSNWKLWNSGVKSIKIEGPFVSGTWFSMELPEGDIIRSQLVDVSQGKHFIDETWIGDTLIRVEHRIEAVRLGLSKFIYAIRTQGSDAQFFGEGISSDFPQVMTGLAKYLANKVV
ncbi:polyketide cyclase [Rodentibacter mrazii]|uniref:Polyketide cyclase n=1 Tax=Rodentibacter mrazii TaxID=1908257 RepID=A0A1V3ICA6_9PAST|nr:polyketide cyclase [Rodentibacter mrazii]OOF37768.1 polyketide cyclase [Rodentibacter mrazii]